MLFADLVATSSTVTATSARSAKIAALADLLSRLHREEVPVAVAMLTGTPRQGRIGVGWRTVVSVAGDVAPAASPSLTILDVDSLFDRLAATTGAGSAAARGSAIVTVLERATADEAAFLLRLFTGELRQGALAGVMAEAVAKAASVPPAAVRRAAMLSGDLTRAAVVALAEGVDGLARIGLEPLIPVLPMLAATSASVQEAIDACGMSSVEWKLDGVRLQVHRAGREVRIFTRNLNDVTGRLPGLVELARSLPVSAVVLDGEAVGLGDDERPELFQDTMSRFDIEAGSTLAIRFFDCLHLDGADLIDRPLHERLGALDQATGPWRIPGIVTDDGMAAEAFLDEALAAGHEGVMVKNLGSIYEAGRRGSSWRKVKPVRTLDLVVLAAEWGHGRRSGWLSNIHLGARDPSGGYVMVGKTFKGMTDEMLRRQTDLFGSLQESDDGHVVRMRPEVVVEIALDGVQVSTRYPGGVALRFARVRRYRPDKSAIDADTIDAVRALLPARGPGRG
ncbi:MAG TPA: ATP-dependent DNA ligase [Acidimicrobiales bacterium]|jgi:DNA ligase-1